MRAGRGFFSSLWTTGNHQSQFAQLVPHKSHVAIFLAQLVPAVFLSHPWPAKRLNSLMDGAWESFPITLSSGISEGRCALPPLSLPVASWDSVIQQEVRGRLDCDFQGVKHSQGSSGHHQLKTAFESSGNWTPTEALTVPPVRPELIEGQ